VYLPFSSMSSNATSSRFMIGFGIGVILGLWLSA
jgi:hypothetical protein